MSRTQTDHCGRMGGGIFVGAGEAEDCLDPHPRGLRPLTMQSQLARIVPLLFLFPAFWVLSPIVPDAMAAAGNAVGKPEVSSESIALSGRQATATPGDVDDPDGIDENTLS